MPAGAKRVQAVRGPWRGVFDTPSPTGGDPAFLRSARNVCLGLAGEWKGRPGWRQLARPAAVGPAQALAGVTFGAGDDRTMAVVGGRLWAYTWATDTWADVTPAGRAIAQPGRVALVVFAGQLVVSDGVNLPWAWNPATGAGTTIAWASGPWYGAPVVYYAKLFGILAASRDAVEWSEEQSLTQGGTVGGFNNGWNLIQTSRTPLVALAATNEALYVFRTTSTGRILGAVTPRFQSDGVQDGVSAIHGACSPWGVHVDQDAVWWLNQRGRLVRGAGGQGVSEHWQPMDAALRQVAPDNLARAWIAGVDDLGALALALPRPDFHELLLVDTEGEGQGAYWGAWAHAAPLDVECAMGAECVDDTGRRRFVHLSLDGTPYVQGLDRDDVAADTYPVAIVARLRGPERRGAALVAGPTGDGVTGATAAGQRRAAALAGPRPGMLRATPVVPVPEVALTLAPLAGATARAVVAWDALTLEMGLPGSAVGTVAQATLGAAGFGARAPRPVTVPGAAGKLTVGRAALGRVVPLTVAGDAARQPAPETAPRFRLWRVTVDGQPAGDDAGAA